MTRKSPPPEEPADEFEVMIAPLRDTRPDLDKMRDLALHAEMVAVTVKNPLAKALLHATVAELWREVWNLTPEAEDSNGRNDE